MGEAEGWREGATRPGTPACSLRRRRVRRPVACRSAAHGRRQADVYASEHLQGADGGPLRWLASTSLAGAVGGPIVTAMFGWTERKRAPATQRCRGTGVGRTPNGQVADPTSGAMAVAITNQKGAAVPEAASSTQKGSISASRPAWRPPQGAGRERCRAWTPGVLYADTTPLRRPGPPAGAAAQAGVKVIELFGERSPTRMARRSTEGDRGLGGVPAGCGTRRGRSGTQAAPGASRLWPAARRCRCNPCRDAAVQHVDPGEVGVRGSDSAETTAAGPPRASMRASSRGAGLGIPAEALQQVLKVDATTTDFTRASRGRRFELFSTPRARASSPALCSPPLWSPTASAELRFRRLDGRSTTTTSAAAGAPVLMRQPVRCPEARMASGFERMHPLLQVMRAPQRCGLGLRGWHADMAAGSGRGGGSGPQGRIRAYVFIRHGNGYDRIRTPVPICSGPARRRQGAARPDHRHGGASGSARRARAL